MKEILEKKLLEFGEYSLKVSNIISLIFFIGIVIGVFLLLKHLITRSKSLDSAKKFSVTKLTKYLIIAISFIISLNLLGFNISVLLAGSAAMLVGLGFGLQNLFNDFISGLILLLDGTLKVGDIIEVNSMIFKVQ
jgi:small-conductance mechanosensitive channel